MSKYWREYRSARRRGENNTQAKRTAKFLTQTWYHRMKQTVRKRALVTVAGLPPPMAGDGT